MDPYTDYLNEISVNKYLVKETEPVKETQHQDPDFFQKLKDGHGEGHEDAHGEGHGGGHGDGHGGGDTEMT